MIRAVQAVSPAPDTEQAVRMLAVQQAYACAPVWRAFVSDSGGTAVWYDGQLYVCGGDGEEWALFAAMDPTVRCLHGDPAAAQAFAGRTGGTVVTRTVLRPERLTVAADVETVRQASPEALWQLLRAGFGDDAPEHDGFYVDVSHRMRHGWMQLRAVRQGETLLAAAVTVALCDGAAVIGAVATRPEARGRGYASACVTQLAQALTGQQRRVFLCPKNEYAAGLYASLGFAPCGAVALAYRPE